MPLCHVPGCSGMFRDVPECSMFQVLSTPQQFSPLALEAKVAQQVVEESCYSLQLPIKETVLILCRSTM